MQILTNPLKPPTEGFGSQYGSIIASIVVAELNNVEFVYSPIQAMSHNLDDDEQFIEKKEKLINIINHFPTNTDMLLHKYVPDYYHFFSHHIRYCCQTNAFQKVKELFYQDKDRSKYFSNNQKHIALHIRKMTRFDPRVTRAIPLHRYHEIVRTLRTYFKEPVQFHLHSLGERSEFLPEWDEEDVVLHLNESVEDTFTSMVFADVLIPCESGLSRLAGYLSNGQVLYPRELVTPLNLLEQFGIV